MLKRSAELALRQGVMRQLKVPETGCKAIQISSQVRNVSSLSYATFRNSNTLLTSTSGAIANLRTFSSDETQRNSQTNFDENDMHDAANAAQTEEVKQYAEKSVNSVTLLGRVGINPQLRGTDSNPAVAFSLATSIQYRPGGRDSGNDFVKKTEWHNVVVFKPNLRESVHNYVSKGSRVMVQGRIMYGTVEDKHGNLRTTTSIIAEDVIRFA